MSTAVDQALGRLVAEGTLTPEQARAVARALATETPPVDRPSRTPLLAEIGGYVGGAFVLAAAVVVTGPRWGDLGTAARLAVLGVPALVLLSAAAAVLATTPGGWPVRHRDGAGPRRRLAAAFAVVAAALSGGAAAVLVDRTGDWPEVSFFAGALVVAAAGYTAARTPLLHVATAGAAASLVAAVALRWVDGWPADTLASGVAVVGVALTWLALAVRGVVAERGLGLTVAGVLAFVGAEVAVASGRQAWVGYLVLAALAAASFGGYARSRHAGVLVVGVVALGTLVPQAVLDYSNGALGAAGALLVTGLSILGASLLGLRARGGTRRTPAGPAARTA